jgi:hypothetical protein
MKRTYSIVRSSRLAASADRVWDHAVTMSRVNAELWPLARMSYPREAATLSLSPEQIGRPLFRSTIYFLGLLPVDYDEITIVEFEPGRRFLERSRMFTQAVWQHERTVESCAGGCTITDRIDFSPRLRLFAPLYRPVFAAAFALRHHRLRQLFGTLGEGESLP